LSISININEENVIVTILAYESLKNTIANIIITDPYLIIKTNKILLRI
jgi:hypothetical protein